MKLAPEKNLSHRCTTACLPIDILTKSGYCCLDVLRSQEMFDGCVFFVDMCILNLAGCTPCSGMLPRHLFNTLMSFSFDV